MNLMNLLLGSLTSASSVESVAKKTGLSSTKVKLLLAIAVPILIKAMKNNASSKEGALSLLGALSQHKDTRSAEQQLAGADLEDGAKIIQHILGSDYSGVISQLTGETGLDADQVSQTLSSIAPALLSGLASATDSASQEVSAAAGIASQAVPAGGIGQAFSALTSAGSSASAMTGLLGSLLGGGSQDSKDEIGGALLTSLLSNL